MKTRKITIQDVQSRLSYGVCPVCGDYRLTKMLNMKIVGEAANRKKKFSGSYWACGGPERHQCYYMSESALREVTNEQILVADIVSPVKHTTVIRRTR